LSNFLAAAGVLVAAGAAASAIVLPSSRLRSVAMLLALVLFPVLILGDQWHSAQVVALYLVIAAGVLLTALREWGGGGVPPAGERDTPTSTHLLPCVLAGVVLLYALQTLYSPDFSKSLQNVCFFFVPFSLVYALLRDVHWDRKLLVLVLWVVAAEAIAFVVVGSVEYASRSLFWNDQVIRSNEFHTYFRVK
jgi:putative inorganic carbon (HCO3(-)) transporter